MNDRQDRHLQKQDIHIEGNPDIVIPELIRHSEAQSSDIEGEHIRPMGFALSGGIRGVSAGAGLAAFEESGLSGACSKWVGVSTGVPALLYALSGTAAHGVLHYEEYCTSEDFYNPKNVGNIVNISGLIHQFTHDARSSMRLNPHKILHSEQSVIIPLTEYETGRTVLIEPQNESELMDALKASMTLPSLTSEEVRIQGTRYVDSSISAPFPLIDTMRHLKGALPTSILVFANRPKYQDTRPRKILARAMARNGVPEPIVQKTAEQDVMFDYNMEALRNSKIPYCIFWSSDTLSDFTWNRSAVEHERTQMQRLVHEVIARYK